LCRYALTKLIQIYAVRHLATLIPVSQKGVVINVVNPGMCKTTLARNAKLVFRVVLKTAHMLLGRTAEMGSRTILFAAVAGKESHGCYTSACEIKE
jgi:NAD(P)-dependent dehydrogenase (short-subunit alcohol dehydrogenase family)